MSSNKFDIRLCTSQDVKKIYDIQNIVIENFKDEEKGFFCHLKKKLI